MASLELSGDQLDQLARQLQAAGHDLADLAPANAEAGRKVLDATTPPRATGQLAATLTADASANGVVFASTARYWTFVHWGAPRAHLRARPFFLEALTARQAAVVAVYAEHATNTLEQLT